MKDLNDVNQTPMANVKTATADLMVMFFISLTPGLSFSL
jgi:hypothetical protein